MMNNIYERKRELSLVLSEIDTPQIPTDVISIISGYCIDMEIHEAKVKANKKIKRLDLDQFFADSTSLHQLVVDMGELIQMWEIGVQRIEPRLETQLFQLNPWHPISWSYLLTDDRDIGDVDDPTMMGIIDVSYEIELGLCYKDTKATYIRTYLYTAPNKRYTSRDPRKAVSLLRSYNNDP